MKKLFIISFGVLLSLTAFAQEEQTENTKDDYEIKTLFGGKETSHGGFGAVMVNYTEFDKNEALLVGARGGWIMNHGFSIGIGGYGLVTDLFRKDVVPGEKLQFEMGYGGLYFEPIIGSRWPVHVTFPVLIGAGGAAYTSNDSSDVWNYNTVKSADAFFVVEPGVNLEMNITKFFRIDFGVNYRYVYGLQLSGTKNKDISGWSGGMTLKFGKF